MTVCDMELDVLKGLRRNLVLLSMLELIGGLFFIIRNDNSLEFIIVILGIIAAAYGIITFFTWLVKRDKSGATPVIITSVLGVVAGALLIIFAKSILPFVALAAGIFAGIFGVVKLPNMFSLKKAGYKLWAIILIPIALTVGVGIFVGLNAFKPDFPSNVVSILLGVALILGCAADIMAIAGASNVQKELKTSKEIDVIKEDK
ncbi:MAG: hypothetical protein HDT42_10765 [Ruminococcaceae bacterium]|nr:hypothetical protein [Oscillospiraceae bacterium]